MQPLFLASDDNSNNIRLDVSYCKVGSQFNFSRCLLFAFGAISCLANANRRRIQHQISAQAIQLAEHDT